MTRSQLEHIVRAAAANADTNDIVVIGSQAILGSFPDAPDELLESMEADVFPRDGPADSILIDGGIGVPDFFATIFAALGINPANNLMDGERPVHNTDKGQLIAKLFA